MADEVVAAAEALVAEVAASGDQAATVLAEGMLDGARLNRDIVRQMSPLAQLDAREIDEVDLKRLRLGSDAGLGLMRVGRQIAEGQFRQRRDDAVVELLERLALERAKDGAG